MTFALYPKKIYCPNCHYTGKAKLKRKKIPHELIILLIGIFIISFFFSLLVPFSLIYLLWLILVSFEHVCPICRWRYPLSSARYRRQQQTAE